MLAETGLTAGAQKMASATLGEGLRGFSTAWSNPQPLRATLGVCRSEWDGVPGGTGTLARKPLGVQRVDPPLPKADLVQAGEPDLLAENRLLHAAVPVGSGRTVLHCLTYYGYSGARSGNPVAKRKNELGL